MLGAGVLGTLCSEQNGISLQICTDIKYKCVLSLAEQQYRTAATTSVASMVDYPTYSAVEYLYNLLCVVLPAGLPSVFSHLAWAGGIIMLILSLWVR
jgi:hypothetical protein